MESIDFVPRSELVSFMVIFFAFYTTFLVLRLIRGRLDLYDFFNLWAVAVVPACFALIPGFATWTANVVGVAFPFLVLFGILIFMMFLFVYNLVVKVHRLQETCAVLTQELALSRINRDGNS